MSQRNQAICASGIAAVCIAIALSFVPVLVRGREVPPESKPLGKLVVHEWGTFTNFSGADGVNLDFRPLEANDLPGFVKSSSPWAVFAKREILAQQRMETPITYFYTDTPRTVNVRVDFPQGKLTEWFPDAVGPIVEAQRSMEDVGLPYLDWGRVNLVPPREFSQLRVRTAKGIIPATLPTVPKGKHYAEARETDSAIVEIVTANGYSLFEKFLFYRGLGDFQLPIKLIAHGDDRFEVANSGTDPSGALLLVRIEQERVRFALHPGMNAGESVELELPTTTSTVEALAEAMSSELTAAGLYQKEALAMVNTWHSSWFGENGTRLLYLVPETQTNELLPLSIEPAPDECVRVLVGRLETITPEDCRRLADALSLAAANSAQVKEELKTLGRFAEPAIQFLLHQETDPARRERLEAVLATLRPKKPAG